MVKYGVFTRNIASDKTTIIKNMIKNHGIIFLPEESIFSLKFHKH